MWKCILALIATFLFVQGCNLKTNGELNNQEKETRIMKKRLNEQLLQAVERGEADTISKLIRNGANFNAQDSKGRTAAMIATYNQDVNLVKVLIEAGADVNILDDIKNNPFLYAGAEGYTDILKLTIEAGADPTITNRYGGTALIPASEHGYIDVIKELLMHTDIDVNHVNNLGWTALLEAIILNNGDEKQQETVQLLIDYGADVNIPDKDNVTPLQHAHEKGFREIEQILLKAGAQ